MVDFLTRTILLVTLICVASGNHYKALNVGRSASNDEIRKAYKTLAKKWHPDKNPGNEEAQAKFIEINSAHEVLSDPSKRRDYDHELRYGGGPQYGRQPQYGGRRGGKPQYYRQNQQWQQHGRHFHYQSSHSMTIDGSSFIMYLLVFFGGLVLLRHLPAAETPERDSANGSSNRPTPKRHSGARASPTPDANSRSSSQKPSMEVRVPPFSSFTSIASACAPTWTRLYPDHLIVPKRRVVLYLPCNTTTDQKAHFQGLEAAASKFRTDPLHFFWLDIGGGEVAIKDGGVPGRVCWTTALRGALDCDDTKGATSSPDDGSDGIQSTGQSLFPLKRPQLLVLANCGKDQFKLGRIPGGLSPTSSKDEVASAVESFLGKLVGGEVGLRARDLEGVTSCIA